MSASSATSPLADTVIFCDRSPWAIAVVTCEIDRTWLVRLDAMVFTESVRSRQVPATPRTSAWPPSLPSVPTSRATRVTSSANEDSWSTIVFTVRPMRRNSPRSGRPVDLAAPCAGTGRPRRRPRSPGRSRWSGRPRSSISELTARTPSAQAPSSPPRRGARSSRPSRPTTRRDPHAGRGPGAPAGATTSLKRVHDLAGQTRPARQPDLDIACPQPVERLGQLGQDGPVRIGSGQLHRCHVLLRSRGWNVPPYCLVKARTQAFGLEPCVG